MVAGSTASLLQVEPTFCLQAFDPLDKVRATERAVRTDSHEGELFRTATRARRRRLLQFAWDAGIGGLQSTVVSRLRLGIPVIRYAEHCDAGTCR
jgi:hypothetical protein